MGRTQENGDIHNLYETAITLHRQGEIGRAIIFYYRVLDFFPDIPEVYYNIGHAWFELGKVPEAIESYRYAAELNPHDGDIFYNLGLAYKTDGQFEAAEEAYLQALSLAGQEDLDILYNLGCCYQDSGAIDQACVIYERVLQAAPDHLSALNNLAYLHHLRHNYNKAKKLYERIVILDPGRQSAHHMLASLSGKKIEVPHPEYVRELFDRYSKNFEENLVKNLEYNTYCILRQAVDSISDNRGPYDHGLDLGCGTGLAGEAFQSICTRLTGVDLSMNMIEQAAGKNIYQHLHCIDIIEFIKNTSQIYDLLIAADVLPYLGDLEPLFDAAAKRAPVKGVFCLSSESARAGEWELQITGRYAHNPGYIQQTAKQKGWYVLEQFNAKIRRENNSWIRGSIFVFQKN